MPYCPECGNEVSVGDTRCLSCSYQLKAGAGKIVVYVLGVLAGLVFLTIFLAVVIISALTVLGASISEKFETISSSVEGAPQHHLVVPAD